MGTGGEEREDGEGVDIMRMTNTPNPCLYFPFFGEGGGGRTLRYSIGLPSYGLHKNSLKKLSKGCNSKNARKHIRLIEDFSRNISIKVLLKYLQWLGRKCHFSILFIISLWKLRFAIATKLES